jgi:hypothetical protein
MCLSVVGAKTWTILIILVPAEDSTSADNSRPSFGVLGQQENKRRKVDDEMQSPTTGHQSRLVLGHSALVLHDFFSYMHG